MAATKKLEDMSLEEYQRHQAEQWGKYIAKDVITVHGARAFNAGDPVPVGHIDSGLVDKTQVTLRPVEKDA